MFKILNSKIIYLLIVFVVILIACGAKNTINNENQEDSENLSLSFIEQIKANELFNKNNGFIDVKKIKTLTYHEVITSPNLNYNADIEYSESIIKRKVNIFDKEYTLAINKEDNNYLINNSEIVDPDSLQSFEKESLIDKINIIKESDYQQIGFQKINEIEYKIFEFINDGVKHKYWIDQETKLPVKIEVYNPENTRTFEFTNIKLNN